MCSLITECKLIDALDQACPSVITLSLLTFGDLICQLMVRQHLWFFLYHEICGVFSNINQLPYSDNSPDRAAWSARLASRLRHTAAEGTGILSWLSIYIKTSDGG